MEPNLQGQVSNLVSSMPINNNPNQSPIVSDFNHLDTKIPLSLPHELMPMPPKPSGSMFSTSTTGLFGGPRSMSTSTSSSLQLNANSSTIFEGNGHHLAGSASMSATALLQKAAQMGATATTNVNSPMMQKGFVTNMAPSTFGAMQTQNSQSQVTDGDHGGYVNQFFNANGGVENSVMNDMSMFTGVLDQNSALFKNMEHDSSNNKNGFRGANSNPGLSTHTSGANPSGLSRFSGDVMTVDFLGIGGSRPRNLHGQQNQEMEFSGISRPRMQGFNHFEQQAALEKPMWDV